MRKYLKFRGAPRATLELWFERWILQWSINKCKNNPDLPWILISDYEKRVRLKTPCLGGMNVSNFTPKKNFRKKIQNRWEIYHLKVAKFWQLFFLTFLLNVCQISKSITLPQVTSDIVTFSRMVRFSCVLPLWKAIELMIMPVLTVLKNIENWPFYSQFRRAGRSLLYTLLLEAASKQTSSGFTTIVLTHLEIFKVK